MLRRRKSSPPSAAEIWLADIGSDALELGNRHELHAGVRNRLERRVRRIGRQDGSLDRPREGRRIRCTSRWHRSTYACPEAPQPSPPTRRPCFTYALDVDHLRKLLAAASLAELLGIASAQAQNQPAPLSVTLTGAAVKSVLSDNRGFVRVVDEARRRGCIDPRGALAVREQRPILVVAVGRSARGAVVVHQVDIVVERILPWLGVKLRIPVHVEPPPPKVFTIGPTKAMFSPHPALPRWQVP